MSTWLGAVFAIHQLRSAATDVLQAWLPAALVDVARQTGIDETTVPFPRSWVRVASWDNVREDQQPVVYVTSTGTVGEVDRRAGGVADATWRLAVLAAVRGSDYDQTAERASIYGAAIRNVLTQHRPYIEGLSSIRWVGDSYDVYASTSQRTWAGALVEFDCDVDASAVETPPQRLTPLQPPPDPFDLPDGPVEIVEAGADIGVSR